jgi:hypothetical protein
MLAICWHWQALYNVSYCNSYKLHHVPSWRDPPAGSNSACHTTPTPRWNLPLPAWVNPTTVTPTLYLLIQLILSFITLHLARILIMSASNFEDVEDRDGTWTRRLR